jgi:hypothetical protein
MKTKFKRDGDAYKGWLKDYGYDKAEEFLKVANGEKKAMKWITDQERLNFRRRIVGREYRVFRLTKDVVDIDQK